MFYGESKIVGIGGLVRKASSVCISTFSRPIEVGDVVLEKSKAFLVELRLIHVMGHPHHVIVEGNSAIVTG